MRLTLKSSSEPLPPSHRWRLACKVAGRNLLLFKQTWKSSLFLIFLEPLFSLLAIGYGLGGLIPSVNEYSYVQFFFPALLCVSSMFISYSTAAYENFSKLNSTSIFLTQVTTLLNPEDIVFGEILWASLKGVLSASGICLIGTLLGLIHVAVILPVLLIIFLSCLLFSALGFLVAILAKSHDQLIYPSSGFILPMALLSGTYFPLENLPQIIKYFAYLFPLTHSVRLTRGVLQSSFDYWMIFNLIYLIGCLYFLLKVNLPYFERRFLNYQNF